VSERQQFAEEHTSSNRCGVTMSASVEGNIVAEVMGEKPGIEVRKYPAMIRIDAENKIEFDLDEIAEAIGVEEYTPEDFEIETSTHYGKMVKEDDRILLFANPEDAAEHMGVQLPSQK
jgi:propane monooxygenase coupling protein